MENLEAIIHKDTQLHDHHVDLTVKKIHKLSQAGALDFGGSEFEQAKGDELNPHKKQEDDRYGWWNLSKGVYRATMNEKLKGSAGMVAWITPHVHARQTGLIVNTEMLTDTIGSISMTFMVPEIGCNIKENARLAVLCLMTT